MEKYTNEKSLMVVQDNFLTKVKKFFSRFFFGRDEEVEYDEVDNEENNKPEVNGIEEEPEQKEWKLYNFDADNTDEWPEPKEVSDGQENDNADGESDDVDYEQEPVSQVCKEKEELEQKLKNYYASITNMHK